MARRKATEEQPATSQQRLSAVIKRIRDLMRTDPGLNGDLDRLPQLSWLLFLKAFDDLEQQRDALEVDYQPLLRKEHRWPEWAANTRFTGDTLIKFVNDDLLPTLANLGNRRSSSPLARKVGDVFGGVENRMRSGYQLREVLNELGKVHFTSRDDIHTMAHLYESMLREVRDAAGDSGEFYTPRPVIRFLVQMVDPQPGEIVLDPAAGTGGFLVEAWEHLGGPRAQSVQQRRRLQESLRGFEKKPLPYLLAMMNLILHGIDVPEVQEGNALTVLRENLTSADQVDVVLTNPPFGGAESEDVVKTFPAQYRTAETAWLFLNTVLDKLKVGGRCGIVLPNGVLFAEGVGARIKERLLRECNLHTVVRLPDGVFAPYTSIPTNLLFFEKRIASAGREWSTKETWFYEVLPVDGRKRYTKTKPMHEEDIASCAEWWGGSDRVGRVEDARAWMVPVEQISENGFNLDLHNPNRANDLAHRPPRTLVREIIETETQVLGALHELQNSLKPEEWLAGEFPMLRVGDVLRLQRNQIDIDPFREYRYIGMRSFGNGIIQYTATVGSKLSKLRYFTFPSSALVLSNIKAWEGAVAVTSDAENDFIASNRFLFYVPRRDKEVDPRFVAYYLLSKPGLVDLGRASPGSADRNRTLSMASFEKICIPLPPFYIQHEIADKMDWIRQDLDQLVERGRRLQDALRPALLNATFSRQL